MQKLYKPNKNNKNESVFRAGTQVQAWAQESFKNALHIQIGDQPGNAFPQIWWSNEPGGSPGFCGWIGLRIADLHSRQLRFVVRPRHRAALEIIRDSSSDCALLLAIRDTRTIVATGFNAGALSGCVDSWDCVMITENAFSDDLSADYISRRLADLKTL